MGRRTLNKLPLGWENLNKLVRAGGTFENQGFLLADLGGRAGFKASTSEVKKWKDYMQDKGEERETLFSEKVETAGRRAGGRASSC